jgi:catechol 2,3-dioxygenase-like lactoylglutathione lyase family enzyme
MSLTHLQLLSVPVADQDRARAFYVDALGFDLISDVQMGPGQFVTFEDPDGNGLILQATARA